MWASAAWRVYQTDQKKIKKHKKNIDIYHIISFFIFLLLFNSSINLYKKDPQKEKDNSTAEHCEQKSKYNCNIYSSAYSAVFWIAKS